MATAIVSDDGVKDWLTDLIAGTHFSGMKAHLFSNNHTPANTDTLGSYTEATYTGYTAQSLSGWSASAVTAHVAFTTATQLDFNITSGSQNIYGVYFTDSGSTKLYGAVLDPNAPVAMSATGITDYLITTTVNEQSA